MSNSNFNLGISKFNITNLNDSGILTLKRNANNIVEIEITLTGLPLLKGPFDDKPRPKYIYLFLGYDSPHNFEIISSIDSIFPDDILNKIKLPVSAVLDIPIDNVYESDFVNSYYYITIAVTEISPEDGSDLNMLAHNRDKALLHTKVLTEIEG